MASWQVRSIARHELLLNVQSKLAACAGTESIGNLGDEADRVEAGDFNPLGGKRRWGLVHGWRPLEGDESLRQKPSFLERTQTAPI